MVSVHLFKSLTLTLAPTPTLTLYQCKNLMVKDLQKHLHFFGILLSVNQYKRFSISF